MWIIFVTLIKNRNMKKIICTLSALGLIAITVSAQPVIKIGPEIGGTFGTMSVKYDNETYETQYQPGIRVGAVLDFGFSNHFSLQPGVFYTTNNGTESNFSKNYFEGGQVPASLKDRRRYHINYFQVPVYALYKTGDDLSSRFFIGGGPYLNIAVGGTFQRDYTNTLNGQNIVMRRDYPIGIGNDRTDEIRRLDFGLQATTGFETKSGLYFRLFYGYGILNGAPGDFGLGNEYHQSRGGITIGYLFKLNDNYSWNRP